jgi:large subunit ribosomal protein L22
MDIIAKSNSIRVSPRKIRLVADAIRKLSLEKALIALATLKKRGSVSLEKTLKSAIANAVKNNNLQRENLVIKSIDVLDGSAFKRYHHSTRGRIHPYKKRTSHITVVLTDNKSNIKDQKSKVTQDEPKTEVKKEEKGEKVSK